MVSNFSRLKWSSKVKALVTTFSLMKLKETQSVKLSPSLSLNLPQEA
jgi:hypothetical protein